jgi:hypothetical protein
MNKIYWAGGVFVLCSIAYMYLGEPVLLHDDGAHQEGVMVFDSLLRGIQHVMNINK